MNAIIDLDGSIPWFQFDIYHTETTMEFSVCDNLSSLRSCVIFMVVELYDLVPLSHDKTRIYNLQAY